MSVFCLIIDVMSKIRKWLIIMYSNKWLLEKLIKYDFIHVESTECRLIDLVRVRSRVGCQWQDNVLEGSLNDIILHSFSKGMSFTFPKLYRTLFRPGWWLLPVALCPFTSAKLTDIGNVILQILSIVGRNTDLFPKTK